MVPTTGFMRALRSNAIALLGSDVQATKELFQLLDAGAASDYRFAKALLQGRKTLPWKRDWQEKRLLAGILFIKCVFIFIFCWFFVKGWIRATLWATDLRCRSPAPMGPPHVPCHWRPGPLYPAEQRAAGLSTASPGGDAAEVGPCGWEGRSRPDAAGRGQCGHCSGIGGSQEGVGFGPVKMQRVTEICWTWRKTTSCFVYAAVHPENGFHEVCNITAKLGKRMQMCSECSRCRPLHFTEENLSVIPSNTIDDKNKWLNFNEEMRQNGPGTNGPMGAWRPQISCSNGWLLPWWTAGSQKNCEGTSYAVSCLKLSAP